MEMELSIRNANYSNPYSSQDKWSHFTLLTFLEGTTMNQSELVTNFGLNYTTPSITITLSSISMVIACFLLMVVTIGGNTFVILAFNIEPALQVMTNHWIVSLALTDIILAAVVMPLQISRELFDRKWVFGTIACDLFISLDVLCCTCSIYHLCLISLDRYFCVRYPITYPRIRTPRATLTAICATWLCCISISFPRLLGWKDNREDPYACHMTNMSYMLFSSAVSFYIPLILTCIMYYGIYRVTRAQARKFSCISSSYRLSSGHCLVPDVAAEGFVSAALIATTLDAALSVARPSDESRSRSSEHDGASYSGAGAGGGGGAGVISIRDLTRQRSNPNAIRLRPRFKFIDYLRNRLRTIRDFLTGSRPRTLSLPVESSSTSYPAGKDIELKSSTGSPAISKAILSMLGHPNDSSCRRERIQRARLTRRKQKQETRAAKVVLIVLAAFVLLWAPFFIVNVLSPLCGDSCVISEDVWKLVTWLGYCNSSINPFIYTCFNRTFRRAFGNVFKSCFPCCRSGNQNHSSN